MRRLAEKVESNLLKETHKLGRLSFVEGSEETGGLGKVKLDAGKGNIINRNKRYYSRMVYALAAERAQKAGQTPNLEDANFLGEVDHPMWSGSLQQAAVRFTSLGLEGDMLKAEAVILDTAPGRHLKGLLDGGVGVMVSTRGYGSSKTEVMSVNGKDEEVSVIGEDFWLEGIDFVLIGSNPSGAVTAHESANGNPTEKNIMTLEQLRAEHPELVTALEAEARVGFVAQNEMDAAVTAAKEEGIALGTTNATEAFAASATVLTTVLEAVKPLLPEQKNDETLKAERDAAIEAEKAATAKVATLEAEKAALEAAQVAAQEEALKAEAKAKVAAHVETALAGFAQADLVRDEMLACETVEAVDALFAERKTVIEAVAARAGVKPDDAGTGVADAVVPPTGSSTPKWTTEQMQERARAGLK